MGNQEENNIEYVWRQWTIFSNRSHDTATSRCITRLRDPSSSHSCCQPQQPLHRCRASQSISHSHDTISSHGLDTWRAGRDEVAGFTVRTPVFVFVLSGGDWMAQGQIGRKGVVGVICFGWRNHVPRGQRGGWGTETVHNIVALPSFFSSPPFSLSLSLSLSLSPHPSLHPSLHPSSSTHPSHLVLSIL